MKRETSFTYNVNGRFACVSSGLKGRGAVGLAADADADVPPLGVTPG